MLVSGPIIYLEDDIDDQELFKEVFQSLDISNEIKVFNTCELVLKYLKTTKDRPFLIITDVNLPEMSGIQLREEICRDPYLKRKAIPYIFLSTSAREADIRKAYDLDIQGYFQKENTFDALQSMIKQIVDYWKVCKHPV
ncbi:MAG TPA: response regulator [Flavisolibacter sp.]|nr:response regulator [Flavisolibacter sp.]